MVQKEKLIEEKFLNVFREHPEFIKFKNYTTSARNIADLLRGNRPKIFHDTSDWNPHAKLMQELMWNKIPDIVLRSRISAENRIYIEVKYSRSLSDGIVDSQVVRYFLHLLAMTRKVPKPGEKDIRRALILCAPSSWFKNNRNAKAWKHFLEHFAGLAEAFDIALGELDADSLPMAGSSGPRLNPERTHENHPSGRG